MYEQTKKKIAQFMNEGLFSGASFSFINQKQIEDYMWGDAQVFPKRERLTSKHLFDVASLTKVICTTTVILQLIDTGIIELDQPFSKYYPFFTDEKVTIRHLLTHTSDIKGYIRNRDSLAKDELCRAYQQLESGAGIGNIVSYTDTGMILLGLMLETLLHKDAVTIFKENVLRPLAMTNSRFLPKENTWIVPTEQHKNRGLIKGQTHDPKAFILAEHAGNAGLFTNTHDIKKFICMYMNKGYYNGEKIVSEEILTSLLQDQTPNNKGERSLGWDLKKDKTGQSVLFHTGYTGTFLLLNSVKKEAFVFLSNRIHPIDRKEEYVVKRDELLSVYFGEQ